MSTATTYHLEPFTGSKMDYPAFRSAVTDLASRIISRDYGALGAVLSEVEYLAAQGGGSTAMAFVPLASPGEAPTVANQFPLWLHATAEYQKERQALLNLTMAFVKSLDAGSLALVNDGNNGTRTRTLAWMFARLQEEYGTVTPLELSEATRSLHLPFVTGTFRDHLLKHREVHRIALSTGASLSEAFKVDGLRISVDKIPGLVVAVHIFFASSVKDADMTFDRFATALQRAHDSSAGHSQCLGICGSSHAHGGANHPAHQPSCPRSCTRRSGTKSGQQ